MIVFPDMLLKAAEDAGMKIPQDADDFDPDQFPHFAVFCNTQLCRPVAYHGEHFENAKVIAAIPEAELKTLTLEKLLEKGLSFAH